MQLPMPRGEVEKVSVDTSSFNHHRGYGSRKGISDKDPPRLGNCKSWRDHNPIS